MNLLKIFQSLQKHNFLKGKIHQNNITDIQFLPLGETFCKHLRLEWRNLKDDTNIQAISFSPETARTSKLSFENSEKTELLNNDNFRASLIQAKLAFADKSSFVIKEEINFEPRNLRLFTKSVGKFHITFHNKFNTLLTDTYFFNDSNELEAFHNVQRKHKIRWMRLSSNPSRYALDDLQASSDHEGISVQSVRILARLFGSDITMENIYCFRLLSNNTNLLNFSERNECTIIRSEINLETAACALLMDSLEHNQENSMKLNKRLAPYQCAIFCLFDSKNSADMQDLCLLLSKSIENTGISTFYSSNNLFSQSDMLEEKITETDKVGVPFSIILGDDTLNTGFMKLRDRDTKLSEIIHITDIPTYLLDIFKS